MSDAPRPASAAALRLDFRHRKDLPSKTRRYLFDVLKRVLASEDEADRMALAAHELIENLVKYSNDASSSLEIDVQEREGATHVTVRTRNSVAPERLRDLEDMLSSVATAPDPVAIYDKLLASSPNRKGSGLGLARIRAEADMKLSYAVEGEEVTILAESVVLVRRPK